MERKWLWNRLKAMSIQEIVHRTCRLQRYFSDSLSYRFGLASLAEAKVQSAQRSLFDRCELQRNSGDDPDSEDIAHHRSLWLENKLQLFDADTTLHLGPNVQWLTNPKTKTVTPRQFGRSIDYRDEQCVGEIKYLWEMGRHQFMVPMAIRVSHCEDEKVRTKLEYHLGNWLEQNPIGMGIHWCSSLELSLRLISWCFIHSILQSGGMKNGIFDLNCDDRLLKAHIFHQVKFVVQNYSRYSSSNNHLIGELTGVWMACNVFDLGAKGKAWRDSAFTELEREIQLQTHNDGVNKEQAIYYHLWSMEYFWLAWSVAKRYKHFVSVAFEERIVDMYIYLEAMCSFTDFPAQIGDSDGGVVSRFSTDINQNAYRSLLVPMSNVLQNKHNQSCSSSIYSKNYWYLQLVQNSDMSSLVSLYNRKMEGDRTVDVFESGGYYVFQGQICRLMFKAGPFGYLSTGAHGHADALGVMLAISGDWWLIDPGTYTYHSEGKWRSYFRSTAAHNTLCVNQSDQSEIAGDFLWMKKTDAQVRSIERDCLGARQFVSEVAGYHSGYSDQGVVHERIIKFDGERNFELNDLVSLEFHKCDLQLAYHFHPDIKLQQLDTHHWLATRHDSEYSLSLDLPPQFDWSVKSGEQRPILGWYSEKYGVKTPSSTLVGVKRLLQKELHNDETAIYKTLLVVKNATREKLSDGVRP